MAAINGFAQDRQRYVRIKLLESIAADLGIDVDSAAERLINYANKKGTATMPKLVEYIKPFARELVKIQVSRYGDSL